MNTPKKKILVVEDDNDSRNALCAMLDALGFSYVGFASGKEALKAMKNQKIDMALLDIMMPEMNGFEFLQALRSLDTEWPADETPVIMLTACGDDLEFVALERGADMFCEKFRADSLLVKQIRFLLEM